MKKEKKNYKTYDSKAEKKVDEMFIFGELNLYRL